jgi:hypothetical protein
MRLLLVMVTTVRNSRSVIVFGQRRGLNGLATVVTVTLGWVGVAVVVVVG